MVATVELMPLVKLTAARDDLVLGFVDEGGDAVPENREQRANRDRDRAHRPNVNKERNLESRSHAGCEGAAKARDDPYRE